MKLLTSIVLLSVFLALSAQAKEPLLFIVNHPGSKPYLYFDKEKQIYQGLVPDILQGLIASNQLNIKYLANSRRRSEEYMYEGSADLMMLSKAWLKRPEQLIASLPIHQHRSFLYKSEKFPLLYRTRKALPFSKSYQHSAVKYHLAARAEP